VIVVPVHKPKRSVYGSRKHVSVLFLKFRTFFYDHRAGLGDPAFNWPRLQNRCAGGSPETEAPAAKSIPEEPAKSRRPRSLKQGEAKKAKRSQQSERSEAKQIRGCSSVGRAPDLHSGGRRFDPDQLHQFWPLAHRPSADNGPVAQVARARP
jgi:hypothetical protein